MGNGLPKPASEYTNYEIFSLVWVDATVKTSLENIKATEILHASFNQLKTFEDGDECKKYIQSLPEINRIILICSGRLGRSIVPQIHQLRQICTIYVYCQQIDEHKQWSNNYIKVKGVYKSLKQLIERIEFDQKFQNYKVDEQISISIYDRKIHAYDHFIYSQILINCLLQMPISSAEKSQLYKICKTEYQSNSNQLPGINEFESKYSDKKVIEWFTSDSFLYRMLTKALRIQNLDLLFLFRYVIQDIQSQIEFNRCLSSIDVYRYQLMTKSEFNKLRDSRDEFISINSFLSAIYDEQAAISILKSTQISDDIERVLFEIHADGKSDDIKPFCDIKLINKNGFGEILFSIGSIFQITDIRFGQEDLWIIRITLCTNNDDRLQTLFRDIEQYSDTKEDLCSFGKLLRRIQKFDEAEKYYKRLAKISSSNPKYVQECEAILLTIYKERENHRLHEEHINHSFELLRRNDRQLATSYLVTGQEHRAKGDFKLAFASYQQALSICKEAYYDGHQEVGRCYYLIGSLYHQDKNYIQAIEYYEKAKVIFEDHFSSDYSRLIEIYCNIGDMHQNLLQYDEALINYMKSLQMAQQPTQLSTIMNKIAFIYEQRNDFPQALSYYEKIALLLGLTDVDIKKNNQNIQRIRSQIK